MLNNSLKFRYKLLYHLVMFSILFNFIGYPIYAMVEYYPYYAAKSYNYLPLLNLNGGSYSEMITDKENKQENIPFKTTATETVDLSSSENREDGQSLIEIFSLDKYGVIGYDTKSNSDDPSDNIFTFNIDKSLVGDKEIQLSYEVYGIENASGITRSLNENTATGGYYIQKNNSWKTIEEILVPGQLKNGKNHILFTAPENETIQYKVRNLKVTLASKTNRLPVHFIDKNALYVHNNTSYIKGVVVEKNAVLFINDKKVQVTNQEFEFFLDNSAAVKELDVVLKDPEGNTLYEQKHLINKKIETDQNYGYKKPAGIEKIDEIENDVFAFSSDAIDFSITSEDYKLAKNITFQRLRSIDMAPLGTNVINVTEGANAYRFLPEGAKFNNKVNLSLRYNKELLPKGYSEKDIQVLYFDLEQRRWLAVDTDSIDIDNQKIISLTDHFTDYIAGIIQAPESPEANSFTPTSISDIKIANPTANILQIQPPVANQKGDGTLDFPITIPSGRNGLQPNISVSYNNNGTSGIAGYGWDVQIPYITVDTKFGVPEYNMTKETESYLLNGEELQLKNGNNLYIPHRSFTTIDRINDAVFYPKIEGSFSKIERKGNNPTNYYWIISDKSGTKYYYGNTAAGRFTSGTNSGTIAKWMLERVEDKNGNYMQYSYITKTYNSGNISGGKEVLINSISYTLHPTINYNEISNRVHFINFAYKPEQRIDQTINYRYGFKEVNASSISNIYVSSTAQKSEEDYQIHYNFDYTTGKFGKQLLSSIETRNIKISKEGVTETESYKHTFDYYNDIQDGLFGPDTKLDLYDDFKDEKHSALSSTKESSKTGEITIGGGISPMFNPPAWWPFSNGGTINVAIPFDVTSRSSPTMMLIDIDGDGLDDKVMKIGNSVKYRKNLGGTLFSEQLYKVSNLPELGLFENKTSTSPELSFSLIAGNIQSSQSHSNSRVRTFFTDVNGDGLVDYVKDKIVYFNRIDPNSGLPSFTDNSEFTPNLIFKEGDVEAGISEPLPDLTLGNDLMDVVKVWVAPKSGKVNISGQITKPFVASENGVRYSIEKSSYKVFNPGTPVNLGTPIDPNFDPFFTTYIKSPSLMVVNSETTNYSNVTVTKGDMIFFRINSSQLPTEMVGVNWDPQITYTELDFTSANQYPQYSSKYSDSFVYGNSLSEPFLFTESGNYRLQWDAFTINNSGTYAQLTDDVTITVTGYELKTNADNSVSKIPISGYSNMELQKRTIKANVSNSIPSLNLALNFPNVNINDPDTYKYIEIEVETTSQINWKTLDNLFKPRVLKSDNNEVTYVKPKYKSYNKQVTNNYKSTFPTVTTLGINHNFSLSNCNELICKDKIIFMVIKNQYGKMVTTINGLPAKFRYVVNQNGLIIEKRQFNGTAFAAFTGNYTQVSLPANTTLFVEYYTDSSLIANKLNDYQDSNSLVTATSQATNTSFYRPNIFYSDEMSGFGILFRNWGQFAYKGAQPAENFVPIKRSYLGHLAMAGLSSVEQPAQSEINQMNDLMNTNIDDIGYDFDNQAFTTPNGTNLTPPNIQAIKHFTPLNPDRANAAWSSHERLFVKASEMSPYLRYYNDDDIQMLPIPAPTNVGLYGAVSIIRESTSESNSFGKSISFYGISIGNSTSKATSRQLNDYLDVNGDGYPDIVGNNKVQLTSKRGGLTNSILQTNLLSKVNSNGSGMAAGGSPTHIIALIRSGGKETEIRVGKNTTFSANFGGSEFKTVSTTEQELIDVNGDGLMDIVKPGGIVQLNTSTSFTPTNWSGYGLTKMSNTVSKSLSASFGLGTTPFSEKMDSDPDIPGGSSSNLDLSYGKSGSRSVTKDKNYFIDFNGDGLPDYIDVDGSIRFNTGTQHITSDLSLPRLSESSSSSIGTTKNAAVLIPISIPLIGIIIKVGGGGGKSTINTFSEENVSLRDFDGDGYIDIVKSGSEKELIINYSKIARTNMLRMVNNPTGSRIELDYASRNVISGTGFGNTYKMPFKKWILSRVNVHDGFESDGEDVQRFAFEYKNGLKDRRERKFLGFGEVISYQLREDGSVYRTNIKEYMLNRMPQHEMFLQGNASDNRKYQYIGHLPVRETMMDAAHRILGITEYEYSFYSLGAANPVSDFITSSVPSFSYTDQSRILPLLKENKIIARHFQGSSPNFTDLVNHYAFIRYDRYGNVLEHKDETDRILSKIKYHTIDNGTSYIVNIPQEHTVMDVNNTVWRKSTTELDPSYNIRQINRIKTLDNAGEIATTDLEYNAIGNLVKVIHPRPHMNASEDERFYQEYKYDEQFQQYPAYVSDAYGYVSSTNYVNFGMPLKQTDINGVDFIYKYDGMRRIVEFKGPYHKEWTIRNAYKSSSNGLKYAVTKHNLHDEESNSAEDILHTSTFADGLGRIIQTKKQLEIKDTCESTNTEGYRFEVSGNILYDEFGRATETYLSQEEKDCTGNFYEMLEKYSVLSHTAPEKTTLFYDMQDRPLQQHVYGLNATTSYEYGFGFDGTSDTAKSSERIILPEGNISETYKDHKGRVTSTRQVDQNTGEYLATRYTYDALSQLSEVRDAEDKSTFYIYDSFGQKITTKHPDTGNSIWKYDLTGKVITALNQNLINQNQSVTYKYNFNQLTEINYPSHSVSYDYGSPGNGNYSTGRITRIKDLTGTRYLRYGALGEVTGERRVLRDVSGQMNTFTSTFRYDSWGRMMEMVYPDGEHLLYQYNETGQLISIRNKDGESYLKHVLYNHFDQPTRIIYGNDVVTTNEYDITQRIRSMQLDRPDESTFMRNVYNYDRNQNIVSVRNNYSQQEIIKMGGLYDKKYDYDTFNRLSKASVNWQGYEENHKYGLEMKYNRTHGIKNKNQFHATNTPHYSGETANSYTSDYQYEDPDHQHAPTSIKYSKHDGNSLGNVHFKYDANGNILHAYNDIEKIGWNDREMIWDEQNRLMAVIDDGKKISHYVYDHTGERTFKSEGSISEVNIAGENIHRILDFNDYIMYPSGYMVVNSGKNEVTKHYYINGKRFASRLDKIRNWIEGRSEKMVLTVIEGSDDGKPQNDFNTLAENQGLDLPYATYNINVGNSDANCSAQLQTLLNLYNTPTTQNCRAYIQSVMNSMSPCDALVMVNSYICEPETPPNTPIDTTPPVYTPGQLQEFDCLTELTILIGQYSSVLTPQQINTLSILSVTTTSVSHEDCIRCIEKMRDDCNRAYEATGIWPPNCDDLEKRCNCEDNGGGDNGGGNNGGGNNSVKAECARKALEYIQDYLVFEPELNACEIYQYIKTHFNCDPDPDKIEDPETPGETPDDWIDDGGNSGDPKDEYDESLRKPIWWYHTDHLGSSTYLTDNFGRPSHYYDNLPFGEPMVEHNQSQYYGNQYKFNGKELDSTTGMYYYGARYYEPRFSIFVSVDPLAEQTMEPYSYVGNNPIMFTDPTGMSKEEGGPGDGWLSKMWSGVVNAFRSNKDGDPPMMHTDMEEMIIPVTRKDRGEKAFNIKIYGSDKSIYENDKGIIAGAFRLSKQFRKWSDKNHSEGFYMYDSRQDGAQGDQSLRRKSSSAAESIDVSGIMSISSFVTSGNNAGIRLNGERSLINIHKAVIDGYYKGQGVVESKVTIDISISVWDIKIGEMKPYISNTIRKDTTVNLKDASTVRWKHSQENGKRYQEASKNYFKSR